jgi:hypothetical protein
MAQYCTASGGSRFDGDGKPFVESIVDLAACDDECIRQCVRILQNFATGRSANDETPITKLLSGRSPDRLNNHPAWQTGLPSTKGLITPLEGTLQDDKRIRPGGVLPKDDQSDEDPAPTRKTSATRRPAAAAIDPEDASGLFDHLTGKAGQDTLPDVAARVMLSRMVHQQSHRLHRFLNAHLGNNKVVEKLFVLLPENLLSRVLSDMSPQDYPPADQLAEIIAEACHVFTVIPPSTTITSLKWEFIIDFIAKARFKPFDASQFIQGVVAHFSSRTQIADTAPLIDFLEQRLTAVATQQPGHLSHETATPVSQPEDVSAPPLPSNQTVADAWLETQTVLEKVTVQNAGMVIAAPYLPRLWKQLGMIEKGTFKDPVVAERAVHLLQYMTDKAVETPEYRLVLNKILCGVRTGVPIIRGIDISVNERRLVDGLILGMIANWKGIGKTSTQGFRESFLQRRGLLVLKADVWHLEVESRAFDMLLRSIPWGFAMIKHPWMDKMVKIKWK